MVYASSTQSLACLETVVHLGGASPLPLDRYLVQIRIPLSIWKVRTRFGIDDHVGWDAQPAGKVSLDWGTAWSSGKASLVAVVPSVVVPDELNVLINPAHPDISKVRAGKIRKWTYDPGIKLGAP